MSPTRGDNNDDDNDEDDDDDPGKVWEWMGRSYMRLQQSSNERMAESNTKSSGKATKKPHGSLCPPKAQNILNKFRRDARAQNQRLPQEEENDPTD